MSAQDVSCLLASGSSGGSVPVEHLDYNFIQNCSDIKHLEQILIVLRSGLEGFYPHLIEFCEKHMENLDPKNHFLRKEKPAATASCFSSEEWSQISEDLQHWETNIRMNEVKLNNGSIFCDAERVPAVRCSNTLQENIRTKKQKMSSLPRAYRDWDRFDVEKECAQIDECDTNPAVITPLNIKHTITSTALVDEEKVALARREKEKGNKCFRSEDYEEAGVFYTRSLSLVPSAAAYNNRAQTHIRLQRWTEALSDCQAVLQLEPHNIKALLRRATVHKHLGHLQKSCDDLRAVLLKEPHNTTAQKDLMEITGSHQQKHTTETGSHQQKHTTETGSHQQKHTKGRKLFIQELEDTEDPEKITAQHTKNSTALETKTQSAETMRRSPSEPRRSISITEVDEDADDVIDVKRSSLSLRALSVFEFGQVLNAACADGDLQTCAELLRSITPARLPQFISTQLNAHTISFIITTLNTHLSAQPHLQYEHLKHLHTAHRFSIVLMLLDSEDRTQLINIFENLRAAQTDAFSQNDVKNLANKYI